MAFARDVSFFDRASLAAGVRRCEAVRVERTDAGGQATLATPKMKVRVDLGTGRVAFLDAQGSAGPRREEGRPVPRSRRGPGGSARSTPARSGARTTARRSTASASSSSACWTSRATTSTCGSATPRSSCPSSSRAVATASSGTTRPTPASATCGPGSRSRPPGSSTRPGSPAASPAPTTPGARFETLVATRVDPAIAIAVPGGAKQPNLRIHPSLPPEGEVERAVGGSGRGDRDGRPPLPALLERRHPHVGGRPAGGRPLAPGLAALDRPRPRPARQGQARAQDRVVEGPGDGDGAPPVEDAGAGALDVALVRGRRRCRLLLRLRAGPRPRRWPATGG